MFQPSADIETLRHRAALVARLRDFFENRGFFEVDTPALSQDTVVDRFLNPIPIARDQLEDGQTDQQGTDDAPLWLQTSPEFAMKRLIASGAEAIYQITRAFRAGETGKWHNPEFTMLEWYRVGDSPQSAMELLGELAVSILDRTGFELLTYQQAFQQHAGCDPLIADVEQLKQVAKSHSVSMIGIEQESEIDFWRDLLLTQLVEPKLGFEKPVIIHDWPASQAALAIVRPGHPPVAERFELYADGIELANGYHELRDPDELRRRNQTANQLREQDGRLPLPGESRMIKAMESGLPACCGVALGVDRLVALALGKKSLREVMAFPIDIA
ncbi:MAG: EF-P lysine aminoacylase EpmA [Mariniblastus sp.]|nr:EF-P lysine aminoacylase EpmA [Mariniblastus sp.]